MAKINIIFNAFESVLSHIYTGVLKLEIPQYIARGKANIPAQVIKVPKGIEPASFKAIVNKGEPVTKSTITQIVTTILQTNQILFLFIIIILYSYLISYKQTA